MREHMFYVSREGNDCWSGLLDKPDSKKQDGPFATIARSCAAVRKITAVDKEHGPVKVFIRSGEYILDKPLLFTPEDSGTPHGPVVYMSYPGESAIISGGREITGWEEVTVDGKTMWKHALLPGPVNEDIEVLQLFVNGNRRRRSRLPKEDFYKVADCLDQDIGYNKPQDAFRFAPGEIRAWKNISEIEAVVFHFWIHSRLKIKAVDLETNTVFFQDKTRLGLKTRSTPPLYYMENVFEAIGPGECYFDKDAGLIYYFPMPEETPDKTRIIIPLLEKFAHLKGDSAGGIYVTNVHFKNLSFRYNTISFKQIAASAQAGVEVPGAIVMEGARNCSVEGCEIANIGTYGIELAGGCRGISLVGNHIFDMGAGGIKMGGAANRANLAELTGNNVISDNHIHSGGLLSHCAVGLLITHSGGNTISHNHIHDFYYTGISIGWVWGYAHSVSTDNLVEYNHIHDLGKGLISDMGGIYTLGISTGTVLRRNLIHDVNCQVYGAWGIYLDEGSSGIVVEENVTYNTQTGGFHQHYGRDNQVRNNIFGPCRDHHLERSRDEEHLSFILRNNIFYMKGGDFMKGVWFRPGYIFEKNLYWRADGKKLLFGSTEEFRDGKMHSTPQFDFQQWQARGQDMNSIAADPLFRDPEHRDFSLLPDSPAMIAIGFKPIDLSGVGARGYGETGKDK